MNVPPTRRAFLSTLGAGGTALSVRAAPARPNIVIVVGDDHTIHDAGCYGNKVVRTPNMDRLAREGMLFRRAFTGTAMCTPSRSMMYTGLYPHRNGAHPNHSAVRAGTRSIAHYMQALDYRVALAGKVHVKPRQSFPFEYLKGDPQTVGGFVGSSERSPFCLIIATHRSHAPWPEETSYDPAVITPPSYLVDTPETRRAMAHYYADVEGLDTEIGEYFSVLEDHGLADDALFIYTGDHGAVFPRVKWNLYEAALNVPLIARWPGRIEPGAVSDAMIHFVDVTPTCIDAAGGEPAGGLDGRSFLPVLLGETARHHEAVFGSSTRDGEMNVYPMRSVRTTTHKYIRNLAPAREFTSHITYNRTANPPSAHHHFWESWIEKAKTDQRARRVVERDRHRPAEELYELPGDPWEEHNLARDPAHAELLSSMRGRLDDWMKQQGDRGLATLK